MNLTTYTVDNRQYVMKLEAPAVAAQLAAGSGSGRMLTIRALVEYFYRREQMAQ